MLFKESKSSPCVAYKYLTWIGMMIVTLFYPFRYCCWETSSAFCRNRVGTRRIFESYSILSGWPDLREEVYDDRGFVSSILHFENGQATHRDYLNEDGIWQLCHFFDGRGIVSNPRTDHRFKKNYYISMEEVIWEFFDAYIAQELTPSDCFVVASKSIWIKLFIVIYQRLIRKSWPTSKNAIKMTP